MDQSTGNQQQSPNTKLQTTPYVEHPKTQQKEYFKCVINGKTYEIQVDMFAETPLQQSFPYEDIFIANYYNINWYLVPDQKVQYSGEGYCLAQYQNDNKEQKTFTLQENWVIQITCTLDAYRYLGKLTETQIILINKNTKIEDLFYNLVHDLKNISENKSENKSITLTTTNSKIELVYINELQIRKGDIQYPSFNWDLNIYRDEQILERLIKDSHNQNVELIKKENESLKEKISQIARQLSELKQNQQSLKEELKQNQQSHKDELSKQQQEFSEQINCKVQGLQEIILKQLSEFKMQDCGDGQEKISQITIQMSELKQNQQSHQNSQEQSLSEILKILNRVHPKEKISHNLKPCDLVKTKGCFWVSPKSVQGITTLEFTLKKLNQIGLALGLENNNNSIGNQLAYGIYTKHQLFAFGQTQIKFEYTPQVGDKISLRVDLYEKRVVFEANEQEITRFNLEDLGETEWYLCVGYYAPFENVNDFME